MKTFCGPMVSRRGGRWLALGLLLAALSGCGPRSRPASSLSEQDRTVLEQYETLRAALAADDLRATKRAALALSTTLQKTGGGDPEFVANSVAISTAPALDRARVTFEPLSANVVKLADGVQGYYVFETPIPVGALWVQRSAQPDNPYTGKAMHDTGTLRK